MVHQKRPLRILIIDDQLDDRERLSHTLRHGFSGAVLREVTHKRAFLEAVAQGCFDVVVTEYRLTWGDGLKVLKTIREHAPHAPVIWVSGTPLDEAIASGMKAGLNDYVAKQHLHRLVRVIRESLQRSQLARNQADALQGLRASEQRYRAISELTSDYAYVLRLAMDGTIVGEWVSERFMYITGYTLEALEGRGGWSSLIHPEDLPSALQRRQLWLAGQTDVSEFRILTQSGEERWVRDYTCPTLAEGSSCVVRIYGAGQDITQRRRMEEPLRQAQKMEAIGRLAGGIAHDFNNLLQVISGYSDMLLRRLTRRSPLRQFVREINDAAEQGAILTRQLMAVSRQQLSQPQRLDLKSMLGKITPLLQHILGEDIELRTTVDPTLGQISADSSQLEQVILNLAVNARDAMPRGGHLTIDAANVVLHHPLASQQTPIPPGDYVKLTVSDSGTGLGGAAQAPIVEPPSTARESGAGTELGLFTVFGLVSQNGGKMQMESAPGGGTTCTIYWPRVGPLAEMVTTESPPETATHGKETILLVEDEVIVRDLVRSVLQATGYTVLEAANGEQALRLTNEHHGPIHLLLADVVLPGMSGIEVAERLDSVRRGLHVLYMSGYAQDTVERYGLPVGECIFLQKPFTPTTLLRQVRAALEASKA
jgi:two-component system, cell cycle sensor histidine kinase and response regulator CckA